MVQSFEMRRRGIALAGATLILAAPAFGAVPISSWGFVALFSDTTYVVTGNLIEPGATQGLSGTAAIRVAPSVHDIVIEGGGFMIDGRDTGGTPDLDLGVAMSGIPSGPIRNVVVKNLRFTDVSIGVSIKDYICRAIVEDCEFAGMVNQAAVEIANELPGAQMRWITVRDSWFHDGAGIPVLVRNTANTSGGALIEHVSVVANVVHDYRRSPGLPEPWNGAILFRDGASDVRVWDNLVVGGQGESGLFMTSNDVLARAYNAVSIRGNVFAGATGNIRSAGTTLASGITLDQVTTASGNFATWTVSGNYLVQNENRGIEFFAGANTPPVLPTSGNWWGEDGTVSGTYGNGATNATDAAPRDLPNGVLALPDRAGGADRAVADVAGFAGQVVLLNQNTGAPGIRGFDVDYDHAASFAFRRTVEGPFLRRQAPLTQFYDIPTIGGSGNERTASGAILGGAAPLALGNGVLAVTVLAGTSQDEAPAADVLLDQVALRDPGNYPIAVASLGDADHPVDDTPPAATLTPPGPYPCVGTPVAPVGVAASDDFALEDVAYRFYRVGLDPGCWIPLSLDEPGTAYTGPSSVPVGFAFGDGAYRFELLATDDAGNTLRQVLALTYDATPPADFAGTTGALAVSGATPAIEEVRFSWNGTFEAGGDLRLRYLPYGGAVGNYAYPEYDDAAPIPGPHFPGPNEGVEVDLPDVNAGAVTIPFTIPERSYYYFTLYVRDCAWNPSPGTSPAVRKNSLSYYLGDWDSNVTPACPGSPEYVSGNGEVNFCDLIGLSRAFATTSLDPNYSNYVDIGPTTPGPGPWDRPSTDNVIDFEDLILFAVNFGTVAPLAGEEVAAETALGGGLVRLGVEVVSRDPERIVVALRARGDVRELLGCEAVLAAPGLALVETRPGAIVPAGHFLKAVPGEGTVSVNLALLGAGARVTAPGVLAEIVFAPARSGDPAPALRLVRQKVRDRWNRELDGTASGAPVAAAVDQAAAPGALPAAFALAEPVPNPMNPATTVRFVVPVRSEVRITVYDPAGRVVARPFAGIAEPGAHEITWQAGGQASGLYLIEMSAGDFRQVRKVLALK